MSMAAPMLRPASGAQQDRQAEFREFAAREVAPFAAQWDRDQAIPAPAVARLAGRGYLGCSVPREYGGLGWDAATFGLLNEALGGASCALTGILTVQAMVCAVLLKWGTPGQKRSWLPPLAGGDMIAAFALTEPAGGSATQALATELGHGAGGLVLNGAKMWISCAQFAAVFLVFGMLGGRSVACLVPRTAPGLRVEPIDDLTGFRGAGLARLRFEQVRVSPDSLVGQPGFALSHVAPLGLHYGRLSTACSASGLAAACLERSTAHAASRRTGDARIGDKGMVRSLIAAMATDVEAGRLLCRSACRAEDERLPQAFEASLMAKYFTSRAAVRAASDAVQILGAAGCHASSPVSRYYRDAKIMEIIEGTTQIHEDLLGRMFVDRAGEPGGPARPDSQATNPHVSAPVSRHEYLSR